MDDNSSLNYAALIQEQEVLDRILADSDVQPMVDDQLHRVSTPMNDSCPLDYASVMEELDDLESWLLYKTAIVQTTVITRWLTPTYDV